MQKPVYVETRIWRLLSGEIEERGRREDRRYCCIRIVWRLCHGLLLIMWTLRPIGAGTDQSFIDHAVTAFLDAIIAIGSANIKLLSIYIRKRRLSTLPVFFFFLGALFSPFLSIPCARDCARDFNDSHQSCLPGEKKQTCLDLCVCSCCFLARRRPCASR